jgi:DNA-binding IscR family transcriptional regulator
LEALTRQGLLARTGNTPPTFLPARPLDTTSVQDVLMAVRCAEEQQSWQGQRLANNPVIEQLVERLDAALGEAFAGCTLQDLVLDRGAKGEEEGGEGGRRYPR